MAYNYFPQTYQTPVYYPSQAQPQAPQQAQMQNPLIWVQGEAGAKSYLVAPNSTVTLWDSESQTIYIKSADNTGMPSIRTLDYTIRDAAPKHEVAVNYVTKDDFDEMKAEIDALKKAIRKEKKDG